MRYIVLDIETANLVPEGTDWKKDEGLYLGVSCAATVDESGNAKMWHNHFLPKMMPGQIAELLFFLETERNKGRQIITWNGLGFDFLVLARESFFKGTFESAKALALNHIDPGFQMVCERGFMVKLAKACEGMGLAGKMADMKGALAPKMWKEGRDAQEKVLAYVEQDVRATAELYGAIINRGKMLWVTNSGKISTWIPHRKGDHLLTCREAMDLPEPLGSIRFQPWARSDFAGWAL